MRFFFFIFMHVFAIVAVSAPIVFPTKITHWKSISTYGVFPNDGIDDTRGILNALKEGREDPMGDYFGLPKLLYFPAGTYDVSDSLWWVGCGVTIQGQGMGETVFKVKNNCPGYGDPSRPRAVWQTIWYNMAFRQNFHDLTIRIGSGNPGAIGLDYISSNVGVVSNVEIISEDGQGVAGIMMTRPWPGPCLLKNVRIQGFSTGIKIGQAEYGPTFENITVMNQSVAGIDNQGNVIAIRRFTSTNSVQAIRNSGHLILLEATLTGLSGQGTAIVSTGDLYCRNIQWSGYAAPISSRGTTVNQSPVVEYVSSPVRTLFPCPQRSLGIAIEETPTFVETDVGQFATFDPPVYGSNGELPNIVASGKPTIVLPCGVYLQSPQMVINVPASVRRIVGFDCVVNGEGFLFRVAENSANPLIIERIGNGAAIEHLCGRPLVVKHGQYSYRGSAAAGNLYIEDISIDSVYLHRNQKLYARQYNTESLFAERTKLTNDGGLVWILGIKTEGTGTVLKTVNGGSTEVLGTLIYPVRRFTESSQPGFVNIESNVSLIFRSTAYQTGLNYPVLISETRNGVTRTITTGGAGMTIPLYAGFDSTKMGQLSVDRQTEDRPSRRAASTGRFLPAAMVGSAPLSLVETSTAWTSVAYDPQGRRLMLARGSSMMRRGIILFQILRSDTPVW